MGVFKSSGISVIERPYQNVYVNGNLRRDVVCTSISQSIGAGGSTATFIFPSSYFDDLNQGFRNTFVKVESTDSNNSFITTVFAGYLSDYNAILSTSQDGIALSASSMLKLTDKIFLGSAHDTDNSSAATRKRDAIYYPQYAYYNNERSKTNWTPKTILEDVFTSRGVISWKMGGGLIDSSYRAQLGLGDISLLSQSDVQLDDIVYRNATLADLLQDLLKYFGDLTIKETFDNSGKCLINVVKIGKHDQFKRKKAVQIASWESASNTTANVASLNKSINADGVVSKVVAMGLPHAIQTTFSTFAADSDNRLVKWWNSSLEAEVLANPEGTKRSNTPDTTQTTDAFNQHKEGYEHVFRRYQLPSWLITQLRNKVYSIRNSLVVERNDGSPLPIQVCIYPLFHDESTPPTQYTSRTETNPRVPVLASAELHLDEGYFILQKPAVNMSTGYVATKSIPNKEGTGNQTIAFPVMTFAEIEVSITLTVVSDTRVSSIQSDSSLSGFEPFNNKLTMQFTNKNFRYEQIGTGSEFKLYKPDGTEVSNTYNVFIADEAISTDLFTYPAGTNIVESAIAGNDNRTALRRLCSRVLAAQPKDRISYSIQLPYTTFGYQIGDYITVLNENNYQEDAHQITSISYQLFPSPSTNITTNNQTPMTFDSATIIPQSLYSQQNFDFGSASKTTITKTSKAAFNKDLING